MPRPINTPFLIVFAIACLPWMSTNAVAIDPNIQTKELSSGKAVNYIRVDLSNFDVRVITPLVSLSGNQPASNNPERMPQGFLLSDYLTRYHAIAVMSGGYIDSYSPPTALGFVKSNGTLVAPPHNSWLTNGLFCSDVGRAVIQSASPLSNRSDLRDCLQAGPFLLSAGHVLTDNGTGYLKLAQSVQEQGFICIDTQSRVLLGVSDKMNLPTLIEFLNSPEIGCKDALRLTGQDTAGLRDRNHLFGHDEYLFPNAIGILPKK
jgi:hypothetical protein